MARDPLLAQMHVGRAQLGLEEEAWRDLLGRITGVRSAAGLGEEAKRAVLDELKRLGFQARAPQGRHRRASGKAHVRYVFALWGELKRKGIWRNSDRSSLLAFVEKKTGRADPEWLSAEEAGPVIEALKAMLRTQEDRAA